MLVTRMGSRVPAGGSILLYLSIDAAHDRIVLARAGDTNELELERAELAPHVFALRVPPSTAGGTYEVRVHRAAPRGQSAPWTPGTIDASGAAPTATLEAPRGHFTSTSGPGRWAPTRSISFVLDGPAPEAAVVFSWTQGRAAQGNARWISNGAAELMASGHCGMSPFGATFPPGGTPIRVAFVDARGALGPWATVPVE
jgi:hypothetical protein